MTSRRAFLAQAAAAATAAQSARPNVLFIAVDDLDCRVGCYGDPVARTPNIDRLAGGGVRFDKAYCQYPLCNPTRSSVLSGRYPTSTGVLDNNTWLTLESGQRMLPSYFRDNGYQVETFGKIWHGPNRGFAPAEALPSPKTGGWFTAAERARQRRDDPGYWDRVASPYRNTILPNPHNYAWANVYGPLPDGDPGVDAPIADSAIASMERLAAARSPFFLGVGFHRPHVPLTAPKKYFDMFDPEQMPLPPDFDTEPRILEGVPRDEFRQNIDLFAGRAFTAAEARQAMRAYYASSAYMDAQLGRVLDKLEQLRLEQNTVIVFWGDHGWHLSEKGMWAKGTLFETSARGPLILRDGRRSGGGKASPRTVQYLDIAPTLTDLCGLPRAPWHEGAPLTSLLDNPSAPWDRPAFTVQARGWYLGRSIRTERWRYTEWDEGRRGTALYDHSRDPHEMRNLAATSPQVTAELRAKLRASPIARNPPGV